MKPLGYASPAASTTKTRRTIRCAPGSDALKGVALLGGFNCASMLRATELKGSGMCLLPDQRRFGARHGPRRAEVSKRQHYKPPDGAHVRWPLRVRATNAAAPMASPSTRCRPQPDGCTRG